MVNPVVVWTRVGRLAAEAHGRADARVHQAAHLPGPGLCPVHAQRAETLFQRRRELSLTHALARTLPGVLLSFAVLIARRNASGFDDSLSFSAVAGENVDGVGWAGRGSRHLQQSLHRRSRRSPEGIELFPLCCPTPGLTVN